MVQDTFSANQALQLLWIVEKENDKYELELTKAEVKHLQFCLIEQWDELTTHYKKQLQSQDKLDIILLITRGQRLFKDG